MKPVTGESERIGSALLRRDRSRGVTLIELMIVVVVLAVLGTLAAPSFRGMLADQRLSSATSSLNSLLWLARSESIKRNVPVNLSIAADSAWQVYRCNDGSDTCNAANRQLISTVNGDFGAIALTARDFKFNNQGRLTTGAGSMEIANDSGSHKRCITITTSGKSSSKSGACA